VGCHAADTLYLHRQSAFLVGRHPDIADLKVEHSSCSKQHAVIQFRLKETPGDATNPPSYVVK
jgi:smad nuclear-interacting protein 1